MKASDVMTRRVVTVTAGTTVATAIRLMLQNGISGLAVVDAAGKPVGIVTEGDFLRRTETGTEIHRPRWLEFLLGPGRLADEYVRTHARKVEELMTPNVASVTEDASVGDIVRLMERRQIKRVLVVRKGEIVGIVSRANLLQALASVMSEVAPATVEDAALRDRILAELDKQSWAPRSGINVVVRKGVVDLWGAILDERERRALRVAVENVAGVKAVKDHLRWIEPISGWVVDAEEIEEPAEMGQAT